MFGVARTNGTIQQIVRSLVRLVHGKVSLIPWVFFMLAAAITASGALSLATYSILIPLALSFARSHKVSPLVMGLSILNGTNAGGFSPIAIYWVIVDNVLVDNGIHVQPMPVFWWTFVVNVLLNIGACLLFSGRNGDRLGLTPTRTTGEGLEGNSSVDGQRWTWQQLLTMALFAAMVVGAVFFHLDVGYTAFCIALVLAVIDPAAGKEGTKEIGWGVVLLIAGIVTFINMLETAGIVTLVANNVAHIGTPLLAALLMLVVAALTSAFASTNAMFVVLVPLAAPLLLTGRVELLGFVIALCLSASTVDSSPFSTAGALMLANTEQYLYDRTMKWLMTWAFSMIVIAPVSTWLAFLVL